MRRAFLTSTLLLAALILPCCASGVHGVEVHNQTDRIVRVELLQLRNNGEMSVYSTQTLAPGGEFKNKVDSDERRAGMRVRFTLADAQPSDPNRILLNLPDSKDREYDLVLVGDRLSAKELSKTTSSPKRSK